jgi:hypothetical protein
VADIFFGDTDGALDKAVRLVIFSIMLVFDPLAVLLLIAGNISLKQNEKTISNVGSDINTETPREEPLNEEIQEDDKVEIAKENLTTIEEDEKPIEIPEVTDPVTGQPVGVTVTEKVITHDRPGFHTEEHVEVVKKLEPKYDYSAEYAFREKEDK